MTGLRILVDMDGVVADWGAEYDLELDAAGEAAAGIPRHYDPANVNWDLKAGRTEAERAIINRIMRKPGFYARLRPIEGAREALERLVELGHDVHIVTAPYISNPTCASDKLAWIGEHYGPKWPSRVVITADKTLVRGDILIDDKPEITGAAVPEWTQILFGDYPYNQDARGRQRLTGWGLQDVNFAIWGAVVRRAR